MNPCFVTTSFSPGQQNSGISNALYLLIKYLHEKKGLQSMVFAPFQTLGKKDEDFDYVSIRRFSTTKFLNYGFSISVKKMIEKENSIRKFDFVHSYHYGFFPAAAGYSFSKKHSIPHFFTTAFHPPSSGFKKSLMSFYNNTQGKRILSGSSNIFPFNKNEKNQLSAYSEGRYKIVPCPVNDEIFHPRKTKFSKLTVTYIGTFLPWKGPQIALDMFNKIHEERKDVNFKIIGTGPLENELRLKANKNTEVICGPPAERVSEILSKSDVAVCPTKYESFGSAMAEAMMCGTPVVSTKVGAVPETLGPGGILVDYGDWSGMKKSVELLLDNIPLRKKMSQKAIKHASNYKYKKVCSKIYESYRSYINGL